MWSYWKREKPPKKNIERLLIVGPAWVGDMVMAQSLFILLKQQRPECLLDVIAPPWTLPLARCMPEINRTIPLPLVHKEFAFKRRRAIGLELRQEGYDQAIVLPNSFKSALIPFFANIPHRTGWSREGRRFILNDARKLNKAIYPLMIERFAALGMPKGCALPQDLPKPKLTVSTEMVTATLQKYELNKASNQPILALCPGAEFGPSKRWPEPHYATVANDKLDQGWQVWLFGSAKDQDVTTLIDEKTGRRCLNLAGMTSLGEAIDLLSLAKLVITNDSGLMHIAAALGRPLVAVYGSTSAKFTPPLTTQSKIVATDINCRPCFKRQCPLKHHRCMQELSPQKVLQASEDLL